MQPSSLNGDASGPALTVLIVDDDEDTRCVLADCFAEEGIRAPVASRGLDAIDVAKSILPDAILLDLRMPGLDGFGVMEQLRADPATERIPVVVFTAESVERMDDELRRSGCAAVLRKPCAFDELVATIGRVAGEHERSGIRTITRVAGRPEA